MYDCISNFCNILNKCGCIDYDEDNHSDLKCGGDDCNDNNISIVKCPILLVHGYMVIDPNGTWYTMKDWLTDDGYDVYEIDLEPWIIPANGNIVSYAEKLSNKTSYIIDKTKSAKVDIISHSMGGLVSRWYSRFGYQNNVRKLIMLGTPNHGSELFYAKYALSLLSKVLVKLKIIDKIADFVLGEAGKQMTPYSLFLNMLNHNNPLIFWGADILNPDIEHYTKAGTNDFWLSSWILFGDDDGLVRVKSVKLNNTNNNHEEYYLTHSELTRNTTLYSDVKDILESLIPLEITTVGILGTPPLELLAMTQEAAYIDNNIQSDPKLHNFSISHSNIAVFILSWYDESSHLKLNLIMPNSTIINKTIANATYYPSNTSLNDTIEGFVVENPAEGLWQAKIISENSIETNYTFMVFLDTDLIISLTTDKANYHFEEPINITVNLTNFGSPIFNSNVQASLKTPIGIDTILLYDDGTHGDQDAYDGVYVNTYNETNQFGTYEITASANGTFNNTPYYRQTTIETEVYNPTDLYLNNSKIFFSNNTPNVGEQIQISALVYNNGNTNVENITVEFYKDDPRNYGEYIGKDVIHINSNSFENASILWNSTKDCRYIFIVISPSIIEEDYSNNINNKSIFVIETLTSFQLVVNQSWNLISIPLELTDNSIDYLFSGKNITIFSYNNSWLVPVEINPKLGYWIRANETFNLTLTGTEIEDTNITLNNGWNLISHPYLEPKNISEFYENNIIYSYNGTWSSYIPNKTFNSLQTLKPGYGYWVYSENSTS
jgi:pimeloyl-ACP methyl ester carboxylesterase